MYIHSFLNFICCHKYSKKSQKLIEVYGNSPITKIEIGRAPLPFFGIIAHILSKGDISHCNTFYHACMRITLLDNTQLIIEKNINLTIYKWKKNSRIEFDNVELNKPITFNQLLYCTQKKMKNKYFKFNLFKNNCQDFILYVLKSSQLGTPKNYTFAKQPLVKTHIMGKKIINTFNNIATLVLPFIF
jgi:hypothetical protein